MTTAVGARAAKETDPCYQRFVLPSRARSQRGERRRHERAVLLLENDWSRDLPVRVRAVDAIARAPGAGKLKLVEVVCDAPLARPASPAA